MVKTVSCYPVLRSSNQTFPRMGQRQGKTSDPNFDPNYFKTKSAEKHLISYEIRCFMVAGGGFEPPTSGL